MTEKCEEKPQISSIYLFRCECGEGIVTNPDFKLMQETIDNHLMQHHISANLKARESSEDLVERVVKKIVTPN